MKDASVYKRDGSPYWYVAYYCTEKMARICRATPWRIDAPTGKKNALRWAQAKSQHAAAFRGNAKHETWAAWVVRFLEERYRNSPKTLQRMKGAWGWLSVYLHDNGVHVPNAYQHKHNLGYVEWRMLQKRHCGKLISRNTALLDLKVMSIIMREAVVRGYALSNPCERSGLTRDPVRHRASLTDDEIRLILAECEKREGHLPLAEQWMTTSFLVALYELCRLSSTQVPMHLVDFGRNEITLKTKGRRLGEPNFLTVPIHPALLPRLQALKAAGAAYTCVLPRMASKEWWKLRKELGIEHTCFHSTRVTGITQLWRAGVPESFAMRLAGHKSSVVHRIYQRGTTQDLAPALEKLHYPTGLEAGAVFGTTHCEQQSSRPPSTPG